jgi:hypothetical protein
VLLVAGPIAAVAPPVSAAGGICAVVPCDPVTPTVGFLAAPDGGVLVETGPRTAARMKGLTLYSGDLWDDSSPVLWRIERTGPVPKDWSGEVELGHVPAGFTETVPLTVSLRSASGVGVDNGVYQGTSVLPHAGLRADDVTYDDGDGSFDVSRVEAFRAADVSFSTPPPTRLPPLDPRGGVIALAGVALLVLRLLLSRQAEARTAR